MNQDLLNLSQVFLIPATILVGALGVAGNESLKVGISILGLVFAVLWSIAAIDAGNALGRTASVREWILILLPTFCIAVWLICVLIHGMNFLSKLRK